MEQDNTIYDLCSVIDRIIIVRQEIGCECHKLLEKEESVICPWVIRLVFGGEVEAELAFEGLDLSNHRGSGETFLSYSQQQYIPNKY